MTPLQALEISIANALGSAPEPDHRAGRIMNGLHTFRMTVAPQPGRITLSEMSISAAVKLFAETILHGDEEHMKWLLEAAEAFVDNRPIPPPRNAQGLIRETTAQGYTRTVVHGVPPAPVANLAPETIRKIKHWNIVGPGMPLGAKIETMHQDEYKIGFNPEDEQGVMLCYARILVVDGEIEWIDSRGYSTLVNPGSFKAPTHWRWKHGAGV